MPRDGPLGVWDDVEILMVGEDPVLPWACGLIPCDAPPRDEHFLDLRALMLCNTLVITGLRIAYLWVDTC